MNIRQALFSTSLSNVKRSFQFLILNQQLGVPKIENKTSLKLLNKVLTMKTLIQHRMNSSELTDLCPFPFCL